MEIYAVVHRNPLGEIVKVQSIVANTQVEAAYWFGFNFEGHLSDNFGKVYQPWILQCVQSGGHTVYLYPTTELVKGVATSGYTA